MSAAGAEYAAAVEQLAQMPTLWRRLIDQHRADEHGLCRACGRPGVGTSFVAHPCPIRLLGESARQAHARGTGR